MNELEKCKKIQNKIQKSDKKFKIGTLVCTACLFGLVLDWV